jgi:hypothetical protein
MSAWPLNPRPLDTDELEAFGLLDYAQACAEQGPATAAEQ